MSFTKVKKYLIYLSKCKASLYNFCHYLHSSLSRLYIFMYIYIIYIRYYILSFFVKRQ